MTDEELKEKIRKGAEYFARSEWAKVIIALSKE